MEPILYLQSGKIVLVRYNPDGSISYEPSNFVTNNGTVESIQTSVTINTTDMPDGNSQFPMGVYDTSRDGTVQVNMSSFQPNLYAALMGTIEEEKSDDVLWATEEDHVIGEEVNNKVTLKHAYKTDGTIVIVDNQGSPFSKVDASPSAGEFMVSANEVTFNSVDNGKSILVTYEWQATKTSKIALPSSGARPVMQAIISTIATDIDQRNEFPANIVIDKCKATGDLAPPQMQSTPQGWSFSLRVLKPRGQYNPVYWKHAIES